MTTAEHLVKMLDKEIKELKAENERLRMGLKNIKVNIEPMSIGMFGDEWTRQMILSVIDAALDKSFTIE